ncbi:GyrI-like domain-containing protein [Paenibacillus sp. 598K]|uniref:GyrI-like domain-containing protein n=1 Tax=Paenibacillus sp. 598K TaxID=1117987 RepID=UPI000FFAB08A|nr:GyrI-like domain-containing protein [Paenibacillus sp. 598K]GBF74309.1 GyrI-like domain-containing protein [Paenibacillus sp. 598K]
MVEPQKVRRPPVRLAGYEEQASLNEDLEKRIVEGLRARLLRVMANEPEWTDEGMYLVQTYPDGEWTPDTSYNHLVAVELAEGAALPPGMSERLIPGGSYLKFVHQGAEADIDGFYVEVQEWLEANGYDEPRAYDLEYWPDVRALNSLIEIYIPI